MKRPHPLKWHGGKYYLAKWIVAQFPPHLHYVEPFFGGGAVLFARDPERDWYEGAKDWTGKAEQRGCSEVINDLNHDLMNFYRVLTDVEWFSLFRREVAMRPFSEFVFEEAKQVLSSSDAGPVPRAVAFFIVMRMSRQGLGKDFATMTRNRTRSRVNEQCNAYLSTVAGLPQVHERLQTVAMLSRSADRVIKSEDGPRTLFYLDPPYLHETRTATDCYEYEMTPAQHEALLSQLATIEGKFILSGYPSSLYDEYKRKHDWSVLTYGQPNHSSSRQRKELKTEVLWCNYRP